MSKEELNQKMWNSEIKVTEEVGYNYIDSNLLTEGDKSHYNIVWTGLYEIFNILIDEHT